MSSHKQQLIRGIIALFLVAGSLEWSVRTALASEITPERVVELVNEERVRQGLAVLVVDERLQRAAEAKARDMEEGEYFAHVSPRGVTPWHWIDQSGYVYRYAGENLAIRFVSAEEQHAAWMKSLKHRENIVSPKYQDIGVAVRTVTREDIPVVVVVQMFGVRPGQTLGTAPAKSEEVRGVSVTSSVLESQKVIPSQGTEVAPKPETLPLKTETMTGLSSLKRYVLEWSGVLVLVLIGVGSVHVVRSVWIIVELTRQKTLLRHLL
jgi:hypothetical protein